MQVEVMGAVRGIIKDFTNDVILRFASANRFMPVSLSMADSEKAQASKLKKKNKNTFKINLLNCCCLWSSS
jgi:hypothetical protein